MNRARNPVTGSAVVFLVLTLAQTAGAQCCTYSVGTAPQMTNWPTATTMYENSTTTFWASASDWDYITYTCGSGSTTYWASDTSVCVWAPSDGTALSALRGNTFMWRSPQLGANECSRTVTITIQADDWPNGLGGCGGDRDDAPADSKTLTVTVIRPLLCDNDGNGSLEDCKHCDSDGNQSYDACYACPGDGGGTTKTRCADCDFNSDGVKEGCSTRLTTVAQVQACPDANIAQTTLPPNGCGPGFFSGGGGPGDVNTVLNNPCGIANATSFQACCNTHDNDYGICKKARATSDTAFRDCMTAVCTAAGNPLCVDAMGNPVMIDDGMGGMRQARCQDFATSYYNLVNDNGQAAYDGAQIGSCRCCNAP